jgi:uncharacterized protein with GYD domain
MPKFLIHSSYTVEGLKDLQKQTASGRKKSIAALLERAGGKLDAYYFCLGEDDAIVIADMPSAEAMASVAIAVGGSSRVRTRTIQLLTVEETDRALKKSASYAPPGK